MSKERRVKQISVVWSMLYYVLLVVGAVGFYWYLWPLTESKHGLVSFGTPPVARGKAEVAKAVEAGARKVKEVQGGGGGGGAGKANQARWMDFWG